MEKKGRVILIGGTGVGKTALINTAINNSYSEITSPTSGGTAFLYPVTIDDDVISLQIWDTAGQERFMSLGRMYYNDAACAIGCIDCTEQSSVDQLVLFIESFKDCTPDAPVFITSTKNDLEPVISDELLLNLAHDYSDKEFDKIYKTSSKNGTGIDELLNDVALYISKSKSFLQDRFPASKNEDSKCNC